MKHLTINAFKYRYILPVFLILLGLAGCYYDSEEHLYPDAAATQCDTLNVTYTNYVSQVLDTNCNSCHNASSPSGNVITDSYNDLMVVVNNGKFQGSINHQTGFSPMPKGQNQLPECDLSKMNAWINQGAP